MNTLEFFQRVLPSEGFYCAAVPYKDGRKGFKQRFFERKEDLADFCVLASGVGETVYYAVSSFETSANRKAENAKLTKTFMFDIDVGKEMNAYATRNEALLAFSNYIAKTGLPRPTIVSSGNGLYVYWMLSESLAPAQWLPIATALKNSALIHGLIIDPAVPADLARVLRPIGVMHYGANKEVKVLMEGPEVSPQDIALKVGTVASPRRNTLINNLAIKQDFPPAIASTIQAKCRQISNAVGKQKETSEPYWYATLGTAAYTTTAEEAANAWSSGHPSYDAATVLDKMEQWKKNAGGPTTCAHFEAVNPGGCKGCPFLGKITSPIRLGVSYEEVAAPTTAPDKAEEIIAIPRPFKRTAEGIKITVEDADVDVCPFDIYPIGYGRDESLGYEVVRYMWNRPHVGWVELKFRQAYLTDGHRDFPTVIADQGIVLSSKKQTEIFQVMLRQYTDALRKQKAMTNMYTSMGWKEGTKEFVLGDTIFRRNDDGTITEETVALASAINKTGGGLYTTSGTRDDWVSATRILQQANMPWHMFALGMGFASPLFAFTGLKGMTVSLYGPTGGGKSLVQFWIQSIYGDPDKLHFAAKYTQNSLFNRLGLYGNLPMTIDEATMMPDKEVGDFLYWVSQGRDKARLTRSAEERDAKTWALPVILSTNKSIQSKLIASGLDTDAQMARLLEITIEPHKLFRGDSNAGRKIYNHLMGNYGIVGREYIRELVRLGEDGIRAEIEDARHRFTKKYGAKFAGQERFWEQAIVLQDAGSAIADRLGLLDYDYSLGTRWVLEQLGGVRSSMQDSLATGFDILADYLNENADAALTVMHTGKSTPFVDLNRVPRNDVRIRFDVHRPTPTTPFDRGTMLIDRTHLRKWLLSKGADYKSVMAELVESRAAIPHMSKRVFIAKNTDKKIGQVYVVAFDLTHPQLSGVLNDADGVSDAVAERKLKLVQPGVE